MRRYARLYLAFVRNCLRQAAEFKANFWANVVTNLGWMASLVVLIAIIYRNTDSVAGWNKAEMLVLFGTYTIMRGISNTLFYANLSQLPQFVRKGTMDWILTKPVNSQFYVSLRYLDFADLGQSVGGFFILLYGIDKLHLAHPPTPLSAALFCVMLVSSIVLFYAITLLLMTFSFWLVRLDNLMVLADTAFQIGRTPVDIFNAFGPTAKFILTYILPVAFIAAMPVKVLFQHAALWPTALASVGVAALFFVAASLFWRFGARAYSSASS